MRVLCLVITLAAAVSSAQTQATVCPYPLDVLRSPKGVPASQLDELRATFKRMLRESGVLLPNTGTLNDTLAELKRQDCDRENQCLVALAVRSRSLYAIYVSIDFDVGSMVSVTGRVVRDDGKEMARAAPMKASATAKTFEAVGKELLKSLLLNLEVSKLPAAKPVEPTKVEPPQAVAAAPDAGVTALAPVADAGVEFTPPPPPPLVTSPLKPAGIVTASVSGVAAATGVALLLVGRGQAIPLFDERGALKPGADAKAAQSARTLQGVGVALAATGVAGAVAGAVMVLLAPTESAPKVSVAPIEGGGAVFVKGEF